MATVPALSSVAARMMRTAISARLAAMMRLKGGVEEDDDGLACASILPAIMESSTVSAGGSDTTASGVNLADLEDGVTKAVVG